MMDDHRMNRRKRIGTCSLPAAPSPQLFAILLFQVLSVGFLQLASLISFLKDPSLHIQGFETFMYVLQSSSL